MAPAISITDQSIRVKFSTLNISSAMHIFSNARSGIGPQVFYDFAGAINMSEKNLASLINISSRTISNYREKRKLLEPVQSEHLLKLIALYEKGEELFGNVNEFSYWLNKPFWDSKEKPADWLITPGGVDLVDAELERIAYGLPV